MYQQKHYRSVRPIKSIRTPDADDSLPAARRAARKEERGMDDLKDFRDKDFLEQVTLLQRIESEKPAGAIPALFALHADPLGDQSVDLAVTNTLQALLLANEEKTIAGLSSDSPAIRRLCLRTVGKCEFAAAAPRLIAMAEQETDPDSLLDILTALSRLESTASLPLFKAHFSHPYPLISALCVQMVGILKDEGSFGALTALIDEAEDEDIYDVCPLHVLMAVRSLKALGSTAAITYLASKIHHKNPTARRIIHEALISIGADAVSAVSERFSSGDTDEKILSANILGWLGEKSGADVMINTLDDAEDLHPNVRYAVYEALGRIHHLKGLVFLMDGLAEEDPMLLMSVATALDANLNPGVFKKICEVLAAGDEQSDRLYSAIAASRALNVFEKLHTDERLSGPMFEKIKLQKDAEGLKAFAERLDAAGGDVAKREAAALRQALAETDPDQKTVLAVDDSKAMLQFYRMAVPPLGFAVLTAENGQVAWDILSESPPVDLIVADMNMPVMDGVELTRLIRADPEHKKTPILMATTESQSSQSELAGRAGVTAFINKPFTKETLEAKVKELLG